SVQLQALVDGTWTDVGAPVTVAASPDGPAPAVEIPGDVRTSSVRGVLTARENTHMVVSAIEVLAKVPGTGSDATASRIAVDGEPLAGFDPAVTAYDVPVAGAVPAVEAVAHDPYATVAVEAADAVPGTTTVRVTAEDGTERAYALRWTADAGSAPLAVTAATRCLAGKAYGAVPATNAHDAVRHAHGHGRRPRRERVPVVRCARDVRPRGDGRRDGRGVRAGRGRVRRAHLLIRLPDGPCRRIPPAGPVAVPDPTRRGDKCHVVIAATRWAPARERGRGRVACPGCPVPYRDEEERTTVTSTTSGDVLTAEDGTRWTMQGEIDAAVQARREDELVRLAQSAEGRIHIDLGDVTFMDSGGLRLLYHAATAGSGVPVLERVPRRVRDLLELSGV